MESAIHDDENIVSSTPTHDTNKYSQCVIKAIECSGWILSMNRTKYYEWKMKNHAQDFGDSFCFLVCVDEKGIGRASLSILTSDKLK